MKRKLGLGLTIVILSLIMPMSVSALEGPINVIDGMWDSNWGNSLGDSPPVLLGYYMNVDSLPEPSAYYFGFDTTVAFNTGVHSITVEMDCNQDGDAFDPEDLVAFVIAIGGNPMVVLVSQVSNGDSTNIDTVSQILMDVDSTNPGRLEIAVPRTTQNITACVNSNNNVQVLHELFNSGYNAAAPNAVDINSVNAVGAFLPGLLGTALASASAAALGLRRKKRQ